MQVTGSSEMIEIAKIEEVYRDTSGVDLYLFVWGKVIYDDGFGSSRETSFCHRYNWVMRDAITHYALTRDKARHHDSGNSAT